MKSLQKQVLDNLAQDMQQCIDFEILCGTLVGFGWTRIKIDYVSDTSQAWNTVMNWADENFEGKYQEHNGIWLIENPADATAFALKWQCQ
jgi:hypothetical protein